MPVTGARGCCCDGLRAARRGDGDRRSRWRQVRQRRRPRRRQVRPRRRCDGAVARRAGLRRRRCGGARLRRRRHGGGGDGVGTRPATSCDAVSAGSDGSVFGAASNSPEIGSARIGRLLALLDDRLAEEARDLVVERALLEVAQHRLVLRLHQLLHGADVARRIVVEALGREDGSVVEQVREDVRIVDARVLGLHVPQTAGVADVVVVAEDGTARFHTPSPV